MYCIHLINEAGEGSYLSVKGRTEWKTKRAAMSHVLGIRKIIAKRGHFMGIIICDLETV